MNPKKDPSHKVWIEVLRKMTPEQKLLKVFEMGEFHKKLFEYGLRRRFPHLSEEEFQKLLRKRLDLCHNRNW
jgi:hypothetical protein